MSRSRPSPLTRSVAARCRRAVFLPRRCLLAVSGVVCPAVPCEFTAAPRAVCSWVRCLLAAPTRPRLAPVRQLHLSPFTPFPPPLASPDTPCSYSLLVMAACVYGCTAYIPQLGALRPRRADPSSSRSRQARRADLSSPPSSLAPALSPSTPRRTTSPIHRRAALYRRVRRLLAAPTRHRLTQARQLHLFPSPPPRHALTLLPTAPDPHSRRARPVLGFVDASSSPRRVC